MLQAGQSCEEKGSPGAGAWKVYFLLAVWPGARESASPCLSFLVGQVRGVSAAEFTELADGLVLSSTWSAQDLAFDKRLICGSCCCCGFAAAALRRIM